MTQLTWQGVSGSGQALPPRSSAGLLPLKVRQLQAGVLEPTPTARQGRDVLLQAKAVDLHADGPLTQRANNRRQVHPEKQLCYQPLRLEHHACGAEDHAASASRMCGKGHCARPLPVTKKHTPQRRRLQLAQTSTQTAQPHSVSDGRPPHQDNPTGRPSPTKQLLSGNDNDTDSAAGVAHLWGMAASTAWRCSRQDSSP